MFNVDPLLDPNGLRSNGGPTQTVALQIGSPAINVGDNALCAEAAPAGLGGLDQRGYARFPQVTFKPTATGVRSAVLLASDSPDLTSLFAIKLTDEGQ